MTQRNPFLEDTQEPNPFLETEAPVTKKEQVSALQKKMESYDILGWPQRKIGKAMGIAAQDIAELVPKAIKSLPKLYSEVMGTAENIAHDRPRLLRQSTLGAGGNLLNTFINTPPMVGRYLAHLGLAPKVMSKMPYADFSPEIQKYLIGGEQKPGDVLVSNWPAILSAGMMVKNIVKGTGKLAATSALEKTLDESRAAEQQAIRKSKQEIGRADPDTMQFSVNEKQKRLKELDTHINDVTNQVNQIEVPPEATGDTAHLENAINLSRAAEHAKSQVPHAEAIHENATRELQDVERDIGDHLETGAEHHVDASRLMKRRLEDLHRENTENYDQFTNDIRDQHITIDNSERIRAINDKLLKEVKAGGLGSEAVNKLATDLANIPKTENIPASQYVSAYKAVKGYMRKAFEKANERGTGINEEERMRWRNRGEEAKQTLDQMEQVLKDSLPSDAYDNFKKADSFWRDNIRPLYEEPLYWRIMNREKLPKDMSEALAGGVQGSGLNILQNIAHSDPQVLKHIVGERWDSPTGRRNILNPNARMQSYINRMPELQNLLSTHNQARQIVNRADIEAQRAKFHSDVMADRANEASKTAKTKQAELENAAKLREQKLSEKEKLTKTHEASVKEREEIKNDIDTYLKHIERLTKERDKKESLEKSMKAQKEIDRMEKEMKSKVSGWKRLGKIPKHLFFGEYSVQQLKKIYKYFTD